MVSNKIRTAGVVLAGLALTTAPAFAQQGGHRNRGDGGQQSRGDNAQRSRGDDGQRSRGDDGQRSRADDGQRSRADDGQRSRADDGQRSRGDDGQRSRGDDRAAGRTYASRGESYGRAVPRTFGQQRFYSPRVIRPSIVNIVPYRPYSYRYRPGFSASFYYGAPSYGYRYGYNPYGYGYAVPPTEYLSAVPGRLYGGVRITDAPSEAQVFVDGYYMGVVDEFDGVFQHMNLEAGPHHIEVREPGFEAIAFDVNVQPDQTITFRAEMLPEQP